MHQHQSDFALSVSRWAFQDELASPMLPVMVMIRDAGVVKVGNPIPVAGLVASFYAGIFLLEKRQQ
jgi:hypothetical protein